VVGDRLGCDTASLWHESKELGTLHCTRSWGSESAPRPIPRATDIAREGEPPEWVRRAWSLRTPAVAEDVGGAPISALAPGERFMHAVAIPITYGDIVYGVIELIRRDTNGLGVPDEAVRTAAAVLGKQLGQFVAREGAFQDLVRSRRELADLFENAPVGLHLMDRDGRILRVNLAELEMFGYARDELVGRRWRDLHVDPAAADAMLSRLAAAPDEPLRAAEARLRRNDGAVRWVRIDANVFRDERGFIHVRPFVRDVTEAKAAEVAAQASEERYRRLIEGAREVALHALDADGRVTGWSSGAQRLYGYAESEVLGRDFALSFGPQERADDVPARALHLAADEGEYRTEGFRVRKDGTSFWAEVVYTALRDPDGRLVSISQLTRDATERRRVEALRRRCADLDAMNREALESSRRGADLLRSVVAAVGAPVAQLAAAVHRLRSQGAGAEPDVAGMSAAVGELSRVLRDLSETAVAAPAHVGGAPVPVELLRVAVETIDLLREAATEKRIRVDVDVDSTLTDVVSDPARLQQVLYNLLSNAIGATRERGRVALRILPEGVDRFRVEVEDSGIGIPERELGAVFLATPDRQDGAEPGPTQASIAPDRVALVATKRVVEDQGGRVAATSTLGRGSVLVAVLPRTQASASAVGSAPAKGDVEAAADRTRRVLVVSDDPATRAAVSWKLGHVGVEAVAASHGDEGLDGLRRGRYDAVAVDLFLGGIGALDFIATLRSEGHGRDVERVLVAVGTRGALVSCLSVSDVLARPAPADRLFAALERQRVPRGRRGAVVVVDGDVKMLEATTNMLGVLGFDAIAEPAGDAGLRACAEAPPAIVVLSPFVHGMDPFTFLRHLRLLPTLADVPVVLLLPRELSEEQIEAIREGAAAASEDVAWARAVRTAVSPRRGR
jgi:PAS domain S-box-containing protein